MGIMNRFMNLRDMEIHILIMKINKSMTGIQLCQFLYLHDWMIDGSASTLNNHYMNIVWKAKSA